MAIKLILLDLDGTLLDSEKRLPEENKNALIRAAEKGVLIAPATGRYFGGIPAEPLAPMHTFAPTRIRVRQACHPAGRPCRTLFRVMKCIPARDELPELALMECLPITGRMHQIRAHLSFLGFPILGDKIYGPDESCYLDFIRDGWTPQLAARLLLPRHALHACDLEFPLHGQIIRVHTELPPDLTALLHDNSTHDPSQQ